MRYSEAKARLLQAHIGEYELVITEPEATNCFNINFRKFYYEFKPVILCFHRCLHAILPYPTQISRYRQDSYTVSRHFEKML